MKLRLPWGWSVTGLAALLLLNLLALAFFTQPRVLAERRQEARIRSLERQIEEHRPEAERLRQRDRTMERNAREERALIDRMVGTREATLVPVLAEVEAHAREFGLRTGPRRMEPEEVDDTPLVRLAMTAPVEGGYPALIGFLRRLERSRVFLTVDGIRLAERGGQGSRSTSLDVELSAYFRQTPGENLEIRRGR